MKDNQRSTSIANYLATVEDIEELMGICIGLLGESQSMTPEDRTIAANLLGDAAAIATDAAANERARLLRVAEAAIGGVAVGDNSTIVALFQRHKTEIERLRRKAASAVDAAESTSDSARATAPTEEPAQVSTNGAIRGASPPNGAAQAAEPVVAVADPPADAPAARARKRAPGRKKNSS